MKLCEYGCGREATHQFKNGKWCCENNWGKCSNMKRFGKRKPHLEKIKEKLKLAHRTKPIKVENSGILCEYGCGREATYSPRKGMPRWCCENNHRKCPVNKEKNSNGNIGKQRKYKPGKYIENSGILCEYGCSREARYSPGKGTVKWCCESHWTKCPKKINEIKINSIGRKHSKKSKQKIRESQIGEKNSMHGKGNNIEKLFKNHTFVCIVEEFREEPKSRELQARCKNHNCKNSKEKGGWFTLKGRQLEGRMSAIENPNGNDGCFLYCSEKCKNECPIYGKTVSSLIKQDQIRAGVLKDNYTIEEYNIWRQEVLKRVKYKCEYCGEEAEHCHHSRPQKLEPFFSLDPDYGIACCSKCHYEKGHREECSTGKLSSKVCI